MSDVLTNNAELSGLLWSILVIASMVTRMYLVLEKESQTSTSAQTLNSSLVENGKTKYVSWVMKELSHYVHSSFPM